MGRKLIDRTGQQFNRWTIIEYIEMRRDDNNKPLHYWRCKCSCGKEEIRRLRHITAGTSKSCGCHLSDFNTTNFTTHGMTNSIEYRTWIGMRARVKFNEYYIKRGIKVCPEWYNDFNQFYADMGQRPGPDYSIDRINNDGDYEPTNCRWATQKEQIKNRTNSLYFTIDGITQTMKQWSEEYQIPYRLVFRRVKEGWDIERALNTPSRKKTPRKVA